MVNQSGGDMMREMKIVRRWLGVVGGVWAIAGLSANALSAEWRIATAYPTDNYHTQNLHEFGDALARETKGAITLQIHANATLFKAPEIFPAVKDGKIEGGEVILSSLVKESPLFGLDALPFLVSGYDDARLLWKLSRPDVEKLFAEHGLQLLYSVPWPPQNLYSNRPLVGAKDLEGLRLRTYNPMMQRLGELMGAKPVTIQTTELGEAIAERQIDLMLTSSWTGVDTKAWKGFSFCYEANGGIPKNAVFVSKKRFDALDPAIQSKIKILAAEAEERGWKLSQQNRTHFDQELAVNKLKIQPLDYFLMRQLQRYGEILAKEWLRIEGGTGLNILLRFNFETSKRIMAGDPAKR